MLKALEVKTSQPATPLSLRTASPSSLAAWSPEKTKKGVADIADLEVASRCKKQSVVGAVEVDSKYTPPNALATIHKLRHHCIGIMLLASKVFQIPVGTDKERLMPKLAYVLASPDGHVEVSVVGTMVQRFADPIT